MRVYLVKYIAEVSEKNKKPEKKEMLVKEINIVQALDKFAKKVSLYRRILSIQEIGITLKNTMKIINGNALVEIIKKEQVTASGIIVPGDTLVDDEGIVLDVDPEVSHIVNIGDRVKFNPNNGHDIEYEGKKCKFLTVFVKDSPRTDIVFCYGKE